MRVVTRIGLAAGLAALTAPAPGLSAARSAVFDVQTVQSGPGGKVTLTSKVWITPMEARADVTHPLQGKATFIVSKGWFYKLAHAKKEGVKGQLPPEIRDSKDNFERFIKEFAFDAAQAVKKAKKVRSETVSGYLCDVYTDSQKKDEATRSFTVWMPQKMDPKFALKVNMEEKLVKPGASMQQTLTITLSNVRLNEPVPGSVFAIPSGYKIVEGKPKMPGKSEPGK